VWNFIINSIDYWRQYIKSETTDAVSDVWLDAKPIVQKFLDDIRYVMTGFKNLFPLLLELYIIMVMCMALREFS
jgi:hypothetical protein